MQSQPIFPQQNQSLPQQDLDQNDTTTAVIRRSNYQRAGIVAAVFVFAVIGFSSFRFLSAADQGSVQEAENASLAGNAAVETETSGDTSGGKFVRLGQAPQTSASPSPTTEPSPTTSPLADTLPGHSTWWKIEGDSIETTSFKITFGTTDILPPSTLGQVESENYRNLDDASGWVSFVDKVSGNDYLDDPTDTATTGNGIFGAHLQNGQVYPTGGLSVSNVQESGDCVSYTVTGPETNRDEQICKGVSAIKMTNKDIGELGKEDRFFVPGNAEDLVFAAYGVPDIKGFTAFKTAWSESAQLCANGGRWGWDLDTAHAGDCLIHNALGAEGTAYNASVYDPTFYGEHSIMGFYDDVSGNGVALATPKSFMNFFGDSNPWHGYNMFWMAPNMMGFEILARDNNPTRFVYTFTGGRAGMEQLGKELVDGQYFQ